MYEQQVELCFGIFNMSWKLFELSQGTKYKTINKTWINATKYAPKCTIQRLVVKLMQFICLSFVAPSFSTFTCFHNECLSCFCSILVFSVFKSCPIGTPKRHAMRHTYNNYPETQLNLFCVLLLTWQYLISFRFILWLCLKIARVNKLFDQIKRIIS